MSTRETGQQRTRKALQFFNDWWPPRSVRMALHMVYKQLWTQSDLWQYSVVHLLVTFFLTDLVWTYTLRAAWCIISSVFHSFVAYVAYTTIWMHWFGAIDYGRTLTRYANGHTDIMLKRADWEQYRERALFNRRLNQPTGSATYLLTMHEFWPHEATSHQEPLEETCAHCNAWLNMQCSKMTRLEQHVHLAGLNFHLACVAGPLDDFLYERYRLIRLAGQPLDICNLLTRAIERFCLHHVRLHHDTLEQVTAMRKRRPVHCTTPELTDCCAENQAQQDDFSPPVQTM